MKNQLFGLIGLGLLLAAASAYAQTGAVKANVPFNFVVEKAELPAGPIRASRASASTGSFMTIQSKDRKGHQGGYSECLPIEPAANQDQAGFPSLWRSDISWLKYGPPEITGAANCR